MTTLCMTTADIGVIPLASTCTISTTQKRTGSSSYLVGGYQVLTILYLAPSTVYFRVAIYAPPTAQYSHGLYLYSSASLRIDFIFRPGYVMTSSFGNTTWIFPESQWVVLEGKCVIHPSSGTLELKANGQTILTKTGANFGSTPFTSLVLGGGANASFYVDDIVIDDANWPGLGGLYVLPVTGNGNYTDWTGDYTAIDENPPSDTDFITTDAAASGTKGSFTKTVLPTPTSLIRRVGLFAKGRVDGVGGGIISPFIRSNGIDSIPTGTGVDLSFMPMSYYWDTDPGNGNAAWNPTTVDAMEIGVSSG